MRVFFVLLVLCCATSAWAGAQEGIAALKRGDYASARAEFASLAEAGDTKAMVTLGMFAHQGQGEPVDYDKAMSWYLRAFELGNGDAFNNIGVMYRDGLGVEVDRSLAYALFLTVHMEGMGSQSTVMRANRNLRREAAELAPSQIKTALCWTPEFVRSRVRGRGEPDAPEATLAASTTRPALRDLGWWLEEERGRLPACEDAVPASR